MKRLVCYAHFDGKDQVRPFVLHSLQMIRPCCADLVFVSNSPLTDQDQALLAASATHIIVNNNTGYDFYMWKLGLESVDLSLYDEVILMNSSVFGPLFAMEPVFSAMAAVACDFWGITECFQMQPHIQSYFLVFRKAMVRSEAFRLFWNSVLPYTNKLQVIQSYEVGLTQWFVESGFRAGVYCCFEQIGLQCRNAGKRLRKKDNTSVKFALELLQAGSPFLKRDAVRNRKVDLQQVDQYLEKWGYPRRLIDDEFSEPSGVVCPLCGAAGRLCHKGVKSFVNLHDTNRYDYFRCKNVNCGVLWIHYMPAEMPANMASRDTMIAAMQGNRHAVQHAGKRMAVPPVPEQSSERSNRFSWIRLKKPSSGKVLIVGELLPMEMKQLGQSGWGGVTNFDGSCTTLERLSSLNDGEFAAVILAGVVERWREPDQLLRECHRLLCTDGQLMILTPNAQSAGRKIFKSYWPGLGASQHLIVHTLKSLNTLVSRCGFKVIRGHTTTLQAASYCLRALDSIFNKWNSLETCGKGRWYLVSLMMDAMLWVVLRFIRSSGDDCCLEAVKR